MKVREHHDDTDASCDRAPGTDNSVRIACDVVRGRRADRLNGCDHRLLFLCPPDFPIDLLRRGNRTSRRVYAEQYCLYGRFH